MNIIKNTTEIFYIGIYIRLSKEDDNYKESESVQNQKKLLVNYINELSDEYILIDTYIDDGYTGTNFERPAFKRMLKDIENGKINMVITKDLSRLSRDYIGTGEYVEKWFPSHNVRYIALTDNIDTYIDSTNNDIAPFKAILNDMYAKDLSKKIRTALNTKQKEGKWVGGCPPFGYKTDPKDKNHLVPDKIESPIVKQIFNLFLNGNNINEIKNKLNNENVPTFSYTRGRNFKKNINTENNYSYWNNTTIKKILQNRLYTGDMIQNRRSRLSYKYRKIINNSPDKWIIVEKTHKPLVSKEKFNKVQALLPCQKKRIDKKKYYLLDGLLKCADCRHNIGVSIPKKDGKNYTICNYYRRFKAKDKLCTSHTFPYKKIEDEIIKIILSKLAMLNKNNIEIKVLKEYNHKLKEKSINKNILKLEKEINILKETLYKIYIDKLSKKITENMYLRINNKINNDIKIKEKNLIELKKILNEPKESSITDLKKIISEFLNLTHPTRDLILKLIKHIDIHEDGNIDIYFKFKS